MMAGSSRPRRVLSHCQDFSKALLGGRPRVTRSKNDTINIADRKIKHYSPAASQVNSLSPAELGYIRAWVHRRSWMQLAGSYLQQ